MKFSKLIVRVGSLLISSTLGLSACQAQESLLLLAMLDRSESSIKDKIFFDVTQKTCHGIANASRYGDRASLMGVDGAIPLYADSITIKDPEALHRGCKELFETVTDAPGTITCPSWETIETALHRPQNQELKPFVLAAIHTNEGEDSQSFCHETLVEVADVVGQRGGKVIIAAWTTQEQYNRLLKQTLAHHTAVIFCPTEECVMEELQSIRLPITEAL